RRGPGGRGVPQGRSAAAEAARRRRPGRRAGLPGDQGADRLALPLIFGDNAQPTRPSRRSLIRPNGRQIMVRVLLIAAMLGAVAACAPGPPPLGPPPPPPMASPMYAPAPPYVIQQEPERNDFGPKQPGCGLRPLLADKQTALAVDGLAGDVAAVGDGENGN